MLGWGSESWPLTAVPQGWMLGVCGAKHLLRASVILGLVYDVTSGIQSHHALPESFHFAVMGVATGHPVQEAFCFFVGDPD